MSNKYIFYVIFRYMYKLEKVEIGDTLSLKAAQRLASHCGPCNYEGYNVPHTNTTIPQPLQIHSTTTNEISVKSNNPRLSSCD